MSPRRTTDLDEDDVRIRPSRNKSRPRSNQRPAYAEAQEAFVVAVDRGRFTCRLGRDGAGDLVMAAKSREVGRKGVVVGDVVALMGLDAANEGAEAMARIVRVEPRTTTPRRSADDSDDVERVVVANAEQLVVVVALANPEPRVGLVDRTLVAAYDAEIEPLLCLTKADLAAPDSFLAAYAGLDVPHVVLHKGGDLSEIRERLHNRVSVLIGHSGVGKSTLVNALLGNDDRATGIVNAVTGRGRHTSTSVIALPLPDGGWVIDTPGVRSFGLAHVNAAHIIRAFPDLEPGTEECPRGCTHLEEECGLDAWVAAGHASAERLASFRRLLVSMRAPER